MAGKGTTSAVDEYIDRYEGEKREWLSTMVGYMRENHPDLDEVISYQMPMFKFNGQYIAFSLAKEHFTFHTLDFEMIEEMKTLMPKAKFGRGSAKVRFQDREYMPVLFNAIERIVKRNEKARPKT